MGTIKQTHLISVETLKSFYPIDENAEQKNIISNIIKSENFQIIPLIGKDKFLELVEYINDVKTGAMSNPDNDTLLQNYIEPVIGWFVVSEILYNQTFKTKNIGVQASDPNAYYAVQKAAQKFKDDSNNFLEILKTYLNENKISDVNNYSPEFSLFLGDTTSNDKTIVGNTSVNQYQTGLYL